MKIAIVVPGGVDRSGAERVIPCILWLIERLAARGDEIHVFAFGQEASPARWPLLGATVHNAGWRPRSITTLALIALEHARGAFDVIHAFWAESCGMAGGAAAMLLRRPFVLTLPGGDVASLPSIGYGSLITERGRSRVAWAVARADLVTAPSNTMCALAAETLGIVASRIPLGVALDRWPPATPRERNGPIRLLHVANLNRVKDQETLLQAMAFLRDADLGFDLTIIGTDTLNGAIQRRAAELNLQSVVRFVEQVEHQILRSWVDSVDLLVMSSLHEAGPLVALEAAVAGVPTVGTAVGHIADFSPHAAIAVPCGDPDALAHAVKQVASDEAFRLQLAANAQARAISEDADFTARQFAESYASLCRADQRRNRFFST